MLKSLSYLDMIASRGGGFFFSIIKKIEKQKEKPYFEMGWDGD